MPTKIRFNWETGQQDEVEMEGAELAAYEALRAIPEPTPPPRPDYGQDSTPAEQIAEGVAALRQYLALPSPTGPQTVGALKLTIRGLLFLLRRAV